MVARLGSTRLRSAIDPVEGSGAARDATEPRLPWHMAISRTGDLLNPAERLALEELERAEKRRQELAEQRSELNPPEIRIRTWKEFISCECHPTQRIPSSMSLRSVLA